MQISFKLKKYSGDITHLERHSAASIFFGAQTNRNLDLSQGGQLRILGNTQYVDSFL
jgi:hypothetical protein